MPYALPPELWRLIASSISPRDSAHLALTCAHISDIVRPLLYRAVRLCIGMQANSASETLTLLARDKELARCVVELTLCRDSWHCKEIHDHGIFDSCVAPFLVNLDAIKNMTSLKHLALMGPLFRDNNEQSELGQVLGSTLGVLLEQMTIHNVTFHSDGLWWTDIHDLKTVSWNQNGAFFIVLLESGVSGPAIFSLILDDIVLITDEICVQPSRS